MNNVKTDAFISELVSASIDRTNEVRLVAKQIARRKPKIEGIPRKGDIIHFPALADPTTNTSYTSGSASYEDLVSSEVSLLIDKTYYQAYNVSDLDEYMAAVGLKNSQESRCAYSMSKAIDTAIMGLYTNANLSVTADTTCDSSTIISDIAEVAVQLENAGIERGYICIPPWVAKKLMLAGIRFNIKEGTGASNGLKWTDELDVDCYVTTQVTNTNTAAAPVSQCMFGSYDAICFYDLPTRSYAMRESAGPEVNKISHFKDFGIKVVRPDLLGNIALTYTAESSTI